MAKTLRLDGPNDDVPPFPDDAAWFLRVGQQVDSHEHRERRDRIDDDEIPEWGRIESGVGGAEYVVIDAGDPIPAAWIEPTWSSFHDLYEPLDENGERIRHGDDRDSAVARAAAKIGEATARPSLDDVDMHDLDDMSWSDLRALATQTDRASGNDPAEKIRSDLRAVLDDPGIRARDGEDDEQDDARDETGGDAA